MRFRKGSVTYLKIEKPQNVTYWKNVKRQNVTLDLKPDTHKCPTRIPAVVELLPAEAQRVLGIR